MNLPPYAIYPIIKGEKITLRQVSPSDIADIITISFYDAIQATSVAIANEMQRKIDKDVGQGNSIHWGIADNLTNKLVGTCGYYRGFSNGEGELGCVLLPQFQGKGLMYSAMQLAINFGLEEMQLKRIWAATSKENLKAIKLLERLNFIKIAEIDDNEIAYELTHNN